MIFLFVAMLSLAVSMTMTPIMMRLAPRLGMIDLPDARKVHAQAIPRVGGIGIVVGSLVAVSLFIAGETWLSGYLLGGLVLLAFGIADDCFELGHYTKFVGQIIAAVAVVYWGELWVSSLPFFAGELPQEIGKPFTVFAMIGLINAVNHSDGLDGLAGGETMMSFGCIGYLADMAGAATLVMLCAAVVGSIFGFLRFNTHPARVFMGDAGSQFIGFSLAVALVLLTQRVNSGLSMALPALIVGLPIVDILAVLAQRIAAGGSWFRATRNHLHHRLLDLGFKHHQVVVIIYVVQAAMVISASFCAYASDALVLGIYVCVCSALFAAIAIAERRGWRLSGSASTPPWGELLALRAHRAIIVYVSYSLPVYLLLSGFLIGKVSFDFAVVAGIVLLAVAFRLAFRLKWRTEWLLRLALYSGAASIVFLAQNQDADTSVWHWLPDIYLASLFLAIALASRLGGEQGFVTTPLDVLLVILLLGAALLGLQHPEYADGTRLVLQLAVLFYASELIVASGGAKRYLSEISLVGLSLLLLGKTLGGA